MSKTLNRCLMCGAAVLMVASAGLSSANLSVNASRRHRHTRIQRQMPRLSRRNARKQARHMKRYQKKINRPMIYLAVQGNHYQVKTQPNGITPTDMAQNIKPITDTPHNHGLLDHIARQLRNSKFHPRAQHNITPNNAVKQTRSNVIKQAKSNATKAPTIKNVVQVKLTKKNAKNLNFMMTYRTRGGRNINHANLRYLAAYLGVSQKAMKNANDMSMTKRFAKGDTIVVPLTGKQNKPTLQRALSNSTDRNWENYFDKLFHVSSYAENHDQQYVINHESGDRGDNMQNKKLNNRNSYFILSYGHTCYGKYQLSPSYGLDPFNHHKYDFSPINQEIAGNKYVQGRYKNWQHAKAFWQAHHWY